VIQEKIVSARTPRPTRETRALPNPGRADFHSLDTITSRDSPSGARILRNLALGPIDELRLADFAVQVVGDFIGNDLGG